MIRFVILILCFALFANAFGQDVVRPPVNSKSSKAKKQNSPSPLIIKQVVSASVEIDSWSKFDSTGYAALNKAIGDARIVMLGEPWHGDGGAIRLRGKLVEYLHERMNFDALVFEADFYSLHKVWEQAKKDGKIKQLAADNVYSFWSQTQSAAPLWQYVEKQMQGDKPLIIAGIDTKMTGQFSREKLPDELRARFLQLPDVPPADAESASKTFNILINPKPNASAITKEDFALLLRLVTKLEHHLSEQAQDVFWRQFAQSLRRNLSGENRDPGMAANLIWLATQLYPDKKIIVWAHNNHIATDKWMFYEAPDSFIQTMLAKQSVESIGRATYLGDVVREYFGSRVYSIATIPYSGTYSPEIPPALFARPADFDKTVALAPAPPETLEAAFNNTGRKTAFVNLRPFRGSTESVKSRVFDYTQLQPLSMRLWEGYDGLLFIKKTHELNEMRE